MNTNSVYHDAFCIVNDEREDSRLYAADGTPIPTIEPAIVVAKKYNILIIDLGFEEPMVIQHINAENERRRAEGKPEIDPWEIHDE